MEIRNMKPIQNRAGPQGSFKVGVIGHLAALVTSWMMIDQATHIFGQILQGFI